MQAVIDLDREYALALEGGGAKGAYQIGAWQALREAGMKICAVSGTSVGALNGAMICMDDLPRAKRLWKNITYSQVMEVEDERAAKLFNGELGFKETLGDILRALGEGGADITPLKRLIAANIDEERIRRSDVDFFLMTYSVTDRRLLDIDMRTVPEGYMKDLLLASCYLPVFKNEKLHGKTFLDGGVLDVIPVEALLERGYKDILMLRIFGVGRERRVTIPEDVRLYSIEPRTDLGNVIDFNREKSRRNMVVGYYDAQRFLYGLEGSIYYIEQTHEECYYLKQLLDTDPAVLRELCRQYGLDDGEGRLCRNLAEILLPVIASELRLGKDWNYASLFLGMLEATAKLLRVPKYHVYTAERLQRQAQELAGREDADMEALPAFSRLILNR